MHVLEVKDVNKSFPLPVQDGETGASRLMVLSGVSFVVEHRLSTTAATSCRKELRSGDGVTSGIGAARS